jgi:hypothetical protein
MVGEAKNQMPMFIPLSEIADIIGGFHRLLISVLTKCKD